MGMRWGGRAPPSSLTPHRRGGGEWAGGWGGRRKGEERTTPTIPHGGSMLHHRGSVAAQVGMEAATMRAARNDMERSIPRPQHFLPFLSGVSVAASGLLSAWSYTQRSTRRRCKRAARGSRRWPGGERGSMRSRGAAEPLRHPRDTAFPASPATLRSQRWRWGSGDRGV